MAQIKLNTIQIVLLMAHYKKLLIQIVNMAHICENDMIQIKDQGETIIYTRAGISKVGWEVSLDVKAWGWSKGVMVIPNKPGFLYKKLNPTLQSEVLQCV